MQQRKILTEIDMVLVYKRQVTTKKLMGDLNLNLNEMNDDDPRKIKDGNIKYQNKSSKFNLIPSGKTHKKELRFHR